MDMVELPFCKCHISLNKVTFWYHFKYRISLKQMEIDYCERCR